MVSSRLKLDFFLITEISELVTFYLSYKISLREKWFVLAPSVMIESVMVGKPWLQCDSADSCSGEVMVAGI